MDNWIVHFKWCAISYTLDYAVEYANGYAMAIEEKMMLMSVVLYKSFKGCIINIKLNLLSFSKKMTPIVFS